MTTKPRNDRWAAIGVHDLQLLLEAMAGLSNAHARGETGGPVVRAARTRGIDRAVDEIRSEVNRRYAVEHGEDYAPDRWEALTDDDHRARTV